MYFQSKLKQQELEKFLTNDLKFSKNDFCDGQSMDIMTGKYDSIDIEDLRDMDVSDRDEEIIKDKNKGLSHDNITDQKI